LGVKNLKKEKNLCDSKCSKCECARIDTHC